MTIPKRIIEKAIQGGWKLPYLEGGATSFDAEEDGLWTYKEEGLGEFREWEIIALDRTFWEALGKALGWGESGLENEKGGALEFWRMKAMQFYDLILTYGDTDAFWSEIIPDEK